MEWLQKILGMAQGVTNNGMYDTAEKGAFYGQFALKGAGKYESLMNLTKSAANGDWKGVFAGIGGYMTKKTMDENSGDGLWNAMKSSALGEVVEWGIRSLGIGGVLVMLAIGLLFKPVRDMVFGMFSGKKEVAAEGPHAEAPAGGRGVSGGGKSDVGKDDVGYINTHPDTLKKIGMAINPQGEIVNYSTGQKVSPSNAVLKMKAAEVQLQPAAG